MKILKVIDTLNIGGAEKVFIDLTNLLYESGVAVSTLFILNPGLLENQLHQGIQKYKLNRTWKWSPMHMYQCSLILKKYDIIHCHHRYIYAYINLSASLFGIKSKIILHDHYGLIDIDKQVPWTIRGVLKPKYFIGVSSKLNNWAINQLHVNSEQVYLLPNIVRASTIKQQHTRHYDWVLVSNIKPVKNQLFAVELAKQMGKSLLIIGNVQDYAYYQQVKAASEGTVHSIVIKTGVNNVRPYFSQVQMGLHVSQSETGPLALIEYLSEGLPFITFKTGEVVEMLINSFPEMVVNNFDIKEWTTAIMSLNQINNNQYSQNLIDFYKANFGEQQYVQLCLDIYKKIKADY